jgi:hypothetical protein
MRSPRSGRLPLLAALAVGAALTIAACSGSSSTPPPVFPASTTTAHPAAAASSARGAFDSATADPTTAADINQAKALIGKCITGTPLQQLHTLHLLLFESKTGPNGAEVEQTRKTVFDCAGVPAGQRDNLVNAALTAAEQAHLTRPGHLATYLEVTLPGLLAQAQKGTLTASGPASPAPGPRTTPATQAAS